MVKETSAKKLIRESWIGQAERYEVAGAASKRLEEELALVPERIQKPLMDRMTQVHENDKLISRQRTRIKSQVKGLQRNVKSWDSLANTALSRVKHTGDVQNWAEMIDSDMRVLERTVSLKNSPS
jgi:hypothetical protein